MRKLPVLIEGEQPLCVETHEIIDFIDKNSIEMDWNQVCDFVNDVGILGDGEYTYWERKDLESDCGQEAKYWMRAFYESHPWFDKIILVFTD